MSSEIVPRPSAPAPIAHDPVALGRVLAGSGYFADARQEAQAAVKVLAGQEIGLPPIASMTGIHIVQGKVTIGATNIAAVIRRHPDYDYKVTEHTDQVCAIDVYYRGEKAGTSTFTMEDAQRAGLTKNPTWKSFPANMLFARAISNAARFYAPDVFAGGPVYTPDELGAVIDGETGEVVRLPAQDVSGMAAPAAPEPAADADGAPAEDDDDFDAKALTELLKAEFGAEVVKAAYKENGVQKYADLTIGIEAAVRESCEQLAMGDDDAKAAG